jgi:hypothetical protein
VLKPVRGDESTKTRLADLFHRELSVEGRRANRPSADDYSSLILSNEAKRKGVNNVIGLISGGRQRANTSRRSWETPMGTEPEAINQCRKVAWACSYALANQVTVRLSGLAARMAIVVRFLSHVLGVKQARLYLSRREEGAGYRWRVPGAP